MNKKWLIPIVLLISLSLLGAGAVYAAGGDRTQIFEHWFTVNVEPIEIQIIEYPQWRIYSGRTFTATYRIINHSATPQEMIYNLEVVEPAGPPLSGAVLVDPDGPGPQQPRFYTWGTKVVVGPRAEQSLYVSLSPPLDFVGDLQIKITFDRWVGPRG